MRVLLLALAFVLAAAPALAQSPAAHPPAGWKTWRYADLHVSFRAPPDAQPTVVYSKVTAAVGVVVSDDHITVIGKPDVGYLVGVSDWTGNTNPMSIDNVPPSAVKGMQAHIVGPVRTGAFPGGEARDYDFATATIVGRCRVILLNRRLFQVMVLTTAPAVPADTDAFIAAVTPEP
jgi:hypothetical protein